MLPIDDIPLMSIFWSDVDTRPLGGGFVWYQHTTDIGLRGKALADIRKAYPAVSSIDYLFIATWDHVGYFPSGTDRVGDTHYRYRYAMACSFICHNLSFLNPSS